MGAAGVHAILCTSQLFRPMPISSRRCCAWRAERDRLTIVADQIGGPTPASVIAGACVAMAAQMQHFPNKAGTYHFAGAPDVSWADFALGRSLRRRA